MYPIYENIKKRRTELGMSQATLAEKMGYSDKGMISRIEAGKVDLPYSKILKFAEVLETDPDVLMGEETVRYNDLTEEQKHLLDLYSRSDSAHCQFALLTLKDGVPAVEIHSRIGGKDTKSIKKLQ